MPIRVQNDLPIKEVLERENIFVMDEKRALSQDIRPLQILILNLMPVKEETELQLLRALSNTPLQVDCTFLMLSTHTSKNTSTKTSIITQTLFNAILFPIFGHFLLVSKYHPLFCIIQSSAQSVTHDS